MRIILVIFLVAAALWRAGADWQATISQGYAYRFGTLGGLMAAQWPDNYARLVQSLQTSGVPYVWDPVGAIVLSLPVAVALATVGMALWVTR